MRLSSGFVAWPVLAGLSEAGAGWPVSLFSILISLALIAGTCTRIAALLLPASIAALLFNGSGQSTLLLVACAGNAAALALLGPGAFSIDAHWYGRRVIRLAPRPPDGGDRE